MCADLELNDSLDGLFGAPTTPARPAPARQAPADFVPILERVAKTYTEPCVGCGGSGRWRGIRTCFKCNGSGRKTFKTAPEARAKARTANVAKRAAKIAERAEEIARWKADHADETAWIRNAIATQNARRDRGQPTWDFPQAMADAVHKWGGLTDGQLRAVRNCMAKDAARAEARKATAPAPKEVNAERLTAAFAKARGDARKDGHGMKWLRLFLGTFKFLDAPGGNGYAPAILVREGDRKLGRIQDGRFIRAYGVDDAKEAEVLATIADPALAARTYGLRTGSCSCCGRELTNPESLKLGIGPICAEKWGFM